MLKQRVTDGVCTAQDLEGVGNTAVSAPQCADARDKCAALIADGLTCKDDFCATCTNAGQCDRSCNLCDDGKRRAQADQETCSPATFQTEAQHVTDACCDPGESEARAALTDCMPPPPAPDTLLMRSQARVAATNRESRRLSATRVAVWCTSTTLRAAPRRCATSSRRSTRRFSGLIGRARR